MMFLDPRSPAFQSAIVPFVTAILIVGFLYLVARRRGGRYFAVCGAGIAILAAYWMAFSLPPFPPRAASQKLGYLIAFSSILSIVVASQWGKARIGLGIALLAIVVGLAWIAESKMRQGQFIPLVTICAVAMVVAAGLTSARTQSAEVGVAVLVAAFAIAGIALLAPSASITQMALASGAATGGFLLWTWPKPRLEFAEAGMVAIGAPLIWLAGQASFYSKASDISLLMVAPIAFVPVMRARAMRRRDDLNVAILPVITGLISAAIAAIAIAIAFLGRSGQSGYAG